MATFAEYPQQTMASNSDFTLYPYQEVWSNDQAYLPTSTYADQSYLNATTFDSFQASQAYAPNSFVFDQSFQAKASLQPPSPGYSPALSGSHSFDFQNPPILSSTSDSGASVQSTISSAMGSPSAQPQPSNEWSQQMGMLPGIVQSENMAHDVFSTGFDLETIPVTDKGCVGELTAVSSSQQLQSAPLLSLSSFPTSFDLLREAGPFSHQYGAQNWSLPMQISTDVAQMPTPNVASRARDAFESVSPNDSVFKSPSTPASATSPVLERVMGKRKSSIALPASKRVRGSSPLNQTVSYHESDLPERPTAPAPTFTSPFFSQSSGNFVPPLELSCPSPLLSRISYSLSDFIRSYCGARTWLTKASPDPSLIQPTFSPTSYSHAHFPDMQAVQSPQNMMFAQAHSPAALQSPRQANGKASGTASPYMRGHNYQPYPINGPQRRPSISSVHSRHSQQSLSSEDSNKGLCPIATCGRHVKDLKAHMLTHQNERPEKCPIPTCEYHTKGFARKYDKNRHTLTHYKGTMVCGFCPGSGSAAEKSFNRADVFKRHLTSVHGVEQTPPNARRKSPSTLGTKKGYGRDVSGMCSTCGVTFASAQDFYEHLDDCVLRVVQQADPSEAINEKILTSIADDQQVQETMEKHMLPTTVDYNAPTAFDEEEEGDDDDEVDEEDNDGTYGSRSGKSGKGSLKSRKAGNSS